MNHVHMPKKEASLKVAANTPITASCNATANLEKMDVVSLNIHTARDNDVQVKINSITLIDQRLTYPSTGSVLIKRKYFYKI